MLGRAIIEQLAAENKYQIFAVVSGKRPVSFPDGVIVEKANLLDTSEAAMLISQIQPHTMLHLAWGMEDIGFRESATNFLWMEASTALLRAFAENQGRCFLFAGTYSEYDNVSGKLCEMPRYKAMSIYGECKKALSSMMQNYCTRTGIQFIDARYFTIYGENDRHQFGAIPSAIFNLLQDKPMVCKAPNSVQDYIYVQDAARATIALMESAFCGAVNVASGKPHLMRDVFQFIAHELGKEALLSFENEDQCDLLAVGDTKVLQEAIGPFKITPFEQGIHRTIQWWKDQLQTQN